jgi:hypothetical protein
MHVGLVAEGQSGGDAANVFDPDGHGLEFVYKS